MAMTSKPHIIYYVAFAGLLTLTTMDARASVIKATGPYGGPPGFDRGMASTMYCGNNPESWVRASAGLDTTSGKLTMNIQLETDSTLAGPKGTATAALRNAQGQVLGVFTSDEVGMGGKPPGHAVIHNFSKTLNVPESIAVDVASIDLSALCTGHVDQLFGISPGDIIANVQFVRTAVVALHNASPVVPDDTGRVLGRQQALLRDALRVAPNTSSAAEYIHSIRGGITGQISAANTLDNDISPIEKDPRFQENLKLLLGINAPVRVSDRIWNGMPTQGYPNTVVVRVASNGLCTGVIIAADTVLTAAHCICPGVDAVDEVSGDIYHIVARHLLSANQPSQKTMRGCNAPSSVPADVGLIRVSTNFGPRHLETFASSATIDAASFIRAVGFGETQTGDIGSKEYVDIPIASVNCGGVVPQSSGPPAADQAWYGCTPTFELVAGQSQLGRDTCHGDSGGPVFVHVDDGQGSYREYLAGITSRGITTQGAVDCGDGGIYTRVDREVLNYVQAQGVSVATQ